MKKTTLIICVLLLANFCFAETTTTEVTKTLNDGTTEVSQKTIERNQGMNGTIITETNFTKKQGLAGTTVSSTTGTFHVKSLTPEVINIRPGLINETVTLEGENLDKIESIYLIKNGEIVDSVQIKLDQVVNNTRKINLMFNENYVQDGDLKFVVVSGKEVVSIPGTVTYVK